MPTDERVLCIPASHFAAVGLFSGFRSADESYRARLLDPAVVTFRPRSEVESDPSFKQLIPYVILTCGGAVFHYRRGAAGTEARLRSLRSIGIGGHIAEADAARSPDPYRTGMLREVAEEVAIPCGYSEHPFGFIYDDRSFVGSVHLGVVHRFELERPAAVPREAALAEAGWSAFAELAAAGEQFETWSQLILDKGVGSLFR
jgi:predicted NUDIX family phosphoesterase